MNVKANHAAIQQAIRDLTRLSLDGEALTKANPLLLVELAAHVRRLVQWIEKFERGKA